MSKVWLVTGSATGLGRNITEAVLASGARLVATARDPRRLDDVVKKYGDQVRYIRYDLPLVSMHPWAFSATMAGRAIYRQKPELFWAYKKEVYENQDKISAFTIGGRTILMIAIARSSLLGGGKTLRDAARCVSTRNDGVDRQAAARSAPGAPVASRPCLAR